MNKIQYAFITLLMVSSCKEPDINILIDEELKPYIEKFIEEANERGVQLYLEDLEAQVVDEINIDVDNTYCGYGWYSFEGTKRMRIEIKNSDGCWQNRTTIERENLVFHELGHAYLSRQHSNKTFPNGSPKSMMCASDSANPCNNFHTYYVNEILRNYYLDELFDESVAEPDFINKDNFIRTVFQEGDEEFYSDWELFILENENNDSQFNFNQDSSDDSITLTTNGSISDDTQAIIVKRFELENFTFCNNLKALMDINLEGIIDGYFRVTLSLRERLSDGSLNRFYLISKTVSDNGNYSDFLHELYCLSERTEIVSISFSLHSKTPASITIKNLSLGLFD